MSDELSAQCMTATAPGTSGGLTDRVAAFISGYEAASTPADVQRHAARALANWFACAVGGSQDASVDKLLAVIDVSGNRRQATVLGRNRKIDMANAAFANAFASNALDFDDMHVSVLIHPTGPVVAAALAVAECRRATGQELLDAIVIGIEVELHIGECLFPDHYDTGWHITATAGVLGAAAAAGALLSLDKKQTARALAMAATQAGGLRAMLPNEGKNLNVGRAAYGGVFAALLAEQGLTSAPAILDEPFGYFSVFKPNDGYRDNLADLGRRFLIAGMSLKPYPCGVVIHPVIDACIAISRRHGFAGDAVRGVEIFVHPRTAVLAEKQDPASLITSRFSLHHAAALALTFGAADFATFENTDVADPRLVVLRRCITVHHSPQLPQTQARVIVDLEGLGKVEEHVTQATGGPDNPLSTAQLKQKFVQLCGMAMDDGFAETMFDRCLSIAEVPDVSAFFTA
jgi:2-methylcitrate dehydratase PrpD